MIPFSVPSVVPIRLRVRRERYNPVCSVSSAIAKKPTYESVRRVRIDIRLIIASFVRLRVLRGRQRQAEEGERFEGYRCTLNVKWEMIPFSAPSVVSIRLQVRRERYNPVCSVSSAIAKKLTYESVRRVRIDMRLIIASFVRLRVLRGRQRQAEEGERFEGYRCTLNVKWEMIPFSVPSVVSIRLQVRRERYNPVCSVSSAIAKKLTYESVRRVRIDMRLIIASFVRLRVLRGRQRQAEEGERLENGR
ncbi:MAG: hypothetical protein KatS3mg058_3535 [Roseiflexus sp.]|nr:MAG: hypothetical protein KatS3mg058_3535 [Roseiflexus sp.]